MGNNLFYLTCAEMYVADFLVGLLNPNGSLALSDLSDALHGITLFIRDHQFVNIIDVLL